MGAGASTEIPETLNKEQAQALAGDKWDEAAFDAAATDGSITGQQFKDAMPTPKNGKNPDFESGGKAAGDPKDSDDFAYLTYETCPTWNTDTDSKLFHKSLMAKTCTPELFAKLKDVTTATGYTFSNAIQTGVETPHLGVGACAAMRSATRSSPTSSTPSSRAGTAATTRPP